MEEGTFPCQDSLPWAGLAAAEDAETYTASHLTELAAGERSFAAALQTCDRDRRMRRGDSHPEWMPEVKCMKRIFQGKFETTGYYRGTLLFALGVVYCRVDGDQGVLLQKGVEPRLDVGAIAAARDARGT